jgi:hypothetical protein
MGDRGATQGRKKRATVGSSAASLRQIANNTPPEGTYFGHPLASLRTGA